VNPLPVREILVMTILWWVEGRADSEPHPDLTAAFARADLDALYDLVIAAERDHGQAYLEWLIVHLAHRGQAYLSDAGEIDETTRPADSPDIPARLLNGVRELYARSV
jgi:hypothetical protein